jgi:hypothetical protein
MIKINNDAIIENIDKLVKYNRLINNHELIVSGLFYSGVLLGLVISLYLGALLIWFSVIAKLLGYRYGILSFYERENNKGEPLKVLSKKFFVKQFGFRPGKLPEPEYLRRLKSQMYFFFWFIPFVAFFCVTN